MRVIIWRFRPAILSLVLFCTMSSALQQFARGSPEDSLTARQAKSPRQRTIEDLHREWDSARAAEVKLPPHLKKMGHFLRGRIREINEAGITRANAKSKHVREQFSSPAFH